MGGRGGGGKGKITGRMPKSGAPIYEDEEGMTDGHPWRSEAGQAAYTDYRKTTVYKGPDGKWYEEGNESSGGFSSKKLINSYIEGGGA